MSIQWIIDLLIDKFKNEQEKQDENQIPLHIEDYDYPSEPPPEEKKDKRVIIIDL